MSSTPQYIFKKNQTDKNSIVERYLHSSIAFNGNILLFGGVTKQRFYENNLYLYQPEINHWSEIKPKSEKPKGRCYNSMNLYKDKIYIWAGCYGSNRDTSNDMHEFDLKTQTWRIITQRGDIPTPRCAHTTVIYKNKLFLFGGFCKFDRITNDLYMMDLDDQLFEWKKISYFGKIDRRSDHSALVYKDDMYIYGGWKLGEEAYDDFHVYNFKTNTFEPVSIRGEYPGHRRNMTVVCHENKMYLYGGVRGGVGDVQYVNDLYEFDLDLWIWKKISIFGELPPETQGHTMNLIGNTLYIFGGANKRWDMFNTVHQLTLPSSSNQHSKNIFVLLKKNSFFDVKFN